MLPKRDGNLTIIYGQNDNVRHIRMNGTHPAKLVPSPMGDSVGHWDGDALVIDTVGVKVDAFTSIDRLRHAAERSDACDRTLPADRRRFGQGRDRQIRDSEGTVGGGGRVAGYDPDTSLKGLQLEVTMEDPKVFIAPLTALVTYRHLITRWQEDICADNPVEHYKDEWIGLPKAEHPDF